MTSIGSSVLSLARRKLASAHPRHSARRLWRRHLPNGRIGRRSRAVLVDPRRRGILPLDGFHVAHRLRRVVRQRRFEIRCDSAFAEVLRGCAEASEKRPNTWINDEIVRLYTALFARGAAHSVECWHAGVLVGGL